MHTLKIKNDYCCKRTPQLFIKWKTHHFSNIVSDANASWFSGHLFHVTGKSIFEGNPLDVILRRYLKISPMATLGSYDKSD
jgi:hypothetical protein